MDNVQACIAPAYIIADDGKKYMACATSVEKAIYDDEGTRLDRKLNKIRSDISDMGYGSIVDTQTGEVVISTKSMNSYVELHEIYGQSSQDGAPVPNNPAEIKSVGGYIYSRGEDGENLFNGIYNQGGVNHGVLSQSSDRLTTQDAITASKGAYHIKSTGKEIYLEILKSGAYERKGWYKDEVSITFDSDLTFRVMLKATDDSDITTAELSIVRITGAELPVLRSIGEIKDKLYRDYDGLWKIERYIYAKTINGTEPGWGFYAPNNNVAYIDGVIKAPNAWRNPINTHFKTYVEGEINAYLSIKPDGRLHVYRITSIAGVTDLETFKTWLHNNSVTLQYALTIPETEILPVAQQKALNSLKSYESNTIVYTDSQIHPSLTVDFYSSSVGFGIDRSNAIYNAIDLSINRRMVSNTAVTKPGFLPDALLVTKNKEEISKNKESILHSHGYINTSFPFNSAGWIRIAKNKNAYAAIRGGSADSCTITIKRGYSYDNNEMVQVNLDKIYQKTRLTLVRKFYNRQIIAKMRHVFSEKVAYIEVLYTSNSGNGAYIEIDNPLAGTGGWEAIIPEPTQETVPGYTVDAELDLTREYGSSLINDAYERYHLDSNTPLKLGINLREWSGNKCYLISYTGYWGEGSAHQAVMWLLSCGYNKDAYNIVEIGSTGKNDGYLPTFSVDSDGFIICTAKNKVGGFITVLRM